MLKKSFIIIEKFYIILFFIPLILFSNGFQNTSGISGSNVKNSASLNKPKFWANYSGNGDGFNFEKKKLDKGGSQLIIRLEKEMINCYCEDHNSDGFYETAKYSHFVNPRGMKKSLASLFNEHFEVDKGKPKDYISYYFAEYQLIDIAKSDHYIMTKILNDPEAILANYPADYKNIRLKDGNFPKKFFNRVQRLIGACNQLAKGYNVEEINKNHKEPIKSFIKDELNNSYSISFERGSDGDAYIESVNTPFPKLAIKDIFKRTGLLH